MELSARMVTVIAGLLMGAAASPILAHQPSIKLFDANSSFGTGARTSPDRALPYASKSLILSFAPGDRAVISSTPDGKGPIAIDNFLTINGANVCEGAQGQVFSESCFGPIIGPLRVGVPIDALLTQISPVDVSRFIPEGTTTVQFELRDFGVVAGNTDLFLVTTATVVAAEPRTVQHAFDAAMDLSAGQLRPALVTAFQTAFKHQVTIPLLDRLRDHADGKTIAAIKQQFRQVGAEKASAAASAVAALLDGQTLLSRMQRDLGTLLQEPGVSPSSIERFVARVGAPRIRLNQSIDDILAFGVNAEQVGFEWTDISADIVFNQDGQPKPVFAEAKVKGEVTGEQGEKGGKPATVKAKLSLEIKGNPTPGTSVTFAVGASEEVTSKGNKGSVSVSFEVKF